MALGLHWPPGLSCAASGRIVGTVRILLVRQDASRLRNRMTYAVVEEIVVCAGARRMGIGRRLMDESVAWARTTGGIRIQLGVYSRNADARAFYRRLGYGELLQTLYLDIS
ncbi:MAG: GNAT family N-acetyltransferase [Alphaproteobacteria bacterium]|nr:GNAT family N-acetyltransferase [Alphaproteobacteria bacterium]